MAGILKRAEDRLWADFEDSGAYVHRGIIGSGREDAVANFLSGLADQIHGRVRRSH